MSDTNFTVIDTEKPNTFNISNSEIIENKQIKYPLWIPEYTNITTQSSGEFTINFPGYVTLYFENKNWTGSSFNTKLNITNNIEFILDEKNIKATENLVNDTIEFDIEVNGEEEFKFSIPVNKTVKWSLTVEGSNKLAFDIFYKADLYSYISSLTEKNEKLSEAVKKETYTHQLQKNICITELKNTNYYYKNQFTKTNNALTYQLKKNKTTLDENENLQEDNKNITRNNLKLKSSYDSLVQKYDSLKQDNFNLQSVIDTLKQENKISNNSKNQFIEKNKKLETIIYNLKTSNLELNNEITIIEK